MNSQHPAAWLFSRLMYAIRQAVWGRRFTFFWLLNVFYWSRYGCGWRWGGTGESAGFGGIACFGLIYVSFAGGRNLFRQA